LTLSEINRLEETISKFLNLCSGTAKELKPQEINIDSLLDEILSLVKFQPRPAKIEILRDRALMPLIFKGYRDQLKQAFLNIVMNACEAMPDGGTLRISTRRIGDNLRVVFSDTGRGIDENDMDKIFDPFYTTKDTNAGLGLTVAQQIVLSHQGVIEVKSAPQRGADVFVTFPQNAL
jgi:signal transduction histidine kinase